MHNFFFQQTSFELLYEIIKYKLMLIYSSVEKNNFTVKKKKKHPLTLTESTEILYCELILLLTYILL